MTPRTTQVAAVAVFAALLPGTPSTTQDVFQLDGRWTLNRSRSEIPREVGFNLDGLPFGAGAGATPAGGGRGRRGSPGGGEATADPFRQRPQSADDASRSRQLIAEVRNPPAHLIVTEAQGAITITDDRGRARTFRPDGRQAVLHLDDDVPVGVTSKLEAGKLVAVYQVGPNRDLRYTYSGTTNPPQLTVEIQFVERGGGDRVLLVYEPTSATEAVASTPTTPARSPAASETPASGSPATPSQSFNQQPDAELKGLNALGIVVEDLSAPAAACGLNKDTLEAALSGRLASAGLKVRRNADEDTYLYVRIMTSGPNNGLCVSRYDALLYTHTTATLSYQTKPVLVQVELMRKGSLSGSSAATHGASVLQALQEYADQFAARIRNANK